ncbi:budding uninhibited by benzimidazoles 1 beta [Xenopus laevis]|uniref:Budding uninhibited by benzimidazoles 1 beta n=1 Tax=Xenopus laevis TaxID=8355 RepID=Q8JGT8_XENLA|nr:budding uninhibited by benzimidazoles 1 beta [Xenopus laevis]AAM23315.1 spindle checkpoint protein BubR1 [Xenopus laevis]
MAQAGDEWELSKENVQPLRQGRVMSTLQEVLSQQESASHTAVQQQKQAFELELRFYAGDDPLDVWDRYIKWAEQAFPQGGKESNLCPLLERGVKIFHEEQRYYDDLRYLNICLKFANFCSEPLDLYSYLHSQGIGVSHSLLYITWAEQFEARGNFKKADSMFQQGMQCKAEPLEKLEIHHRQFQARVSRQVLQGISEGPDVEEPELSEPQRSSLADLKSRGKTKAKVPVNRVGDSIKSRPQGLGLQAAPPQQIPNRSRFSVFDENAAMSAAQELPSLTPQQWTAPPPARSKENEQRARPWNSGRPSRNGHQAPVSELPQSLPSFTPYVDEGAQHQTVTPCKINPAVTSVLSSRKPGKDEDPLQRVQNNSQGKEETVMYCKDKVYAGVEEFSLEEIRAEIYMAKVRRKREDDLQASALRRQDMERQIEEMERQLKGSCIGSKETVIEQPAHNVEPIITPCNSKTSESICAPQQEPGMEFPLCFEMADAAPTLPRMGILPVSDVLGNNHNSSGLSPALSCDMPFTIFDESSEALPSMSVPKTIAAPVRRPLAVVSKTKSESQLTDTLDGIEHLNEEAIVCGSGKNKSLFPDPEDTCDFVRAAHLASTPFHRARDESEESLQRNSAERLPLQEKTPVCEESYRQELCIKKLSPILEASQEDTRTSVSSVSSISSTTSMFTSKTLPLSEKLELATQITGVYESEPTTEELPQAEEIAELHRQLLELLPELLVSPEIQHEVGTMPDLKEQEELVLGCETYSLKNEVILHPNSKLFMGAPVDWDMEEMKAFALKVDYQPVPWDLYVTLQLKERLGDLFETFFMEQTNCFLYQNGCISLYKDINRFSIQEILLDSEELIKEVIVLVTYNLLSLVEKLHSVEIVHGDLRPETLLLDDKIFDLSSSLELEGLFKMVDFSHSMDLKLCPTMSSLRGFPIAQSESGQQFLNPQSSPYQVDILGIADLVHLMIFRKPLQLNQENSVWTICKEVPRLRGGNLWNQFFTKILNAEGPSTCVLRELKGEMMELFDSGFQDKLCNYFIQLEMRLNPL